MSAKLNPYYAKCLLALCIFAFTSLTTMAQVEPDTVKRKPTLPTGPPGTEKPVYTPKPQPQPQPPVQQQPKVEQDEPNEEVKEKQEFIDKLYFGGSFGLQFAAKSLDECKCPHFVCGTHLHQFGTEWLASNRNHLENKRFRHQRGLQRFCRNKE